MKKVWVTVSLILLRLNMPGRAYPEPTSGLPPDYVWPDLRDDSHPVLWAVTFVIALAVFLLCLWSLRRERKAQEQNKET